MKPIARGRYMELDKLIEAYLDVYGPVTNEALASGLMFIPGLFNPLEITRYEAVDKRLKALSKRGRVRERKSPYDEATYWELVQEGGEMSDE